MPEAVCHSLPPVLGPDPRVLVLGSMPGAASIRQQQYYAHPRNRFWPVFAHLLGQPLPDDYAGRTRLLQQGGIALWDVLAECRRQGSLDSAIEAGTTRANAIGELVAANPGVRGVLLNGGAAARYYQRLVEPALPNLVSYALPSTSPANARYTLADLQAAWSAAVARLRPAGA